MILSRNRFIDKLETKEPISFQQSIIESQGGSADGALVVLFHPQMDALLVESVTAVQSQQVLVLILMESENDLRAVQLEIFLQRHN